MRSRNLRYLLWTAIGLALYCLVWLVVSSVMLDTGGLCADSQECRNDAALGRRVALGGFVFWALSAYFVWLTKPSGRTRRQYYWRDTRSEGSLSGREPMKNRAIAGLLVLFVASPAASGSIIGFALALTSEEPSPFWFGLALLCAVFFAVWGYTLLSTSDERPKW